MTVKTETLRTYIGSNTSFVETGTEHGHTVQKALDLGAKKVFSCELNSLLYHKAARRFVNQSKVSLHLGNSPTQLEIILKQSEEPVVILLDAHDGQYAPLREELIKIQESGLVPEVIIIDDWRYVRTGYWGFKESDIMCLIGTIYPSGYEALFVDGEGIHVDILEGPPIQDVLVIRKKQ